MWATDSDEAAVAGLMSDMLPTGHLSLPLAVIQKLTSWPDDDVRYRSFSSVLQRSVAVAHRVRDAARALLSGGEAAADLPRATTPPPSANTPDGASLLEPPLERPMDERWLIPFRQRRADTAAPQASVISAVPTVIRPNDLEANLRSHVEIADAVGRIWERISQAAAKSAESEAAAGGGGVTTGPVKMPRRRRLPLVTSDCGFSDAATHGMDAAAGTATPNSRKRGRSEASPAAPPCCAAPRQPAAGWRHSLDGPLVGGPAVARPPQGGGPDSTAAAPSMTPVQAAPSMTPVQAAAIDAEMRRLLESYRRRGFKPSSPAAYRMWLTSFAYDSEHSVRRLLDILDSMCLDNAYGALDGPTATRIVEALCDSAVYAAQSRVVSDASDRLHQMLADAQRSHQRDGGVDDPYVPEGAHDASRWARAAYFIASAVEGPWSELIKQGVQEEADRQVQLKERAKRAAEAAKRALEEQAALQAAKAKATLAAIPVLRHPLSPPSIVSHVSALGRMPSIGGLLAAPPGFRGVSVLGDAPGMAPINSPRRGSSYGSPYLSPGVHHSAGISRAAPPAPPMIPQLPIPTAPLHNEVLALPPFTGGELFPVADVGSGGPLDSLFAPLPLTPTDPYWVAPSSPFPAAAVVPIVNALAASPATMPRPSPIVDSAPPLPSLLALAPGRLPQRTWIDVYRVLLLARVCVPQALVIAHDSGRRCDREELAKLTYAVEARLLGDAKDVSTAAPSRLLLPASFWLMHGAAVTLGGGCRPASDIQRAALAIANVLQHLASCCDQHGRGGHASALPAAGGRTEGPPPDFLNEREPTTAGGAPPLALLEQCCEQLRIAGAEGKHARLTTVVLGAALAATLPTRRRVLEACLFGQVDGSTSRPGADEAAEEAEMAAEKIPTEGSSALAPFEGEQATVASTSRRVGDLCLRILDAVLCQAVGGGGAEVGTHHHVADTLRRWGAACDAAGCAHQLEFDSAAGTTDDHPTLASRMNVFSCLKTFICHRMPSASSARDPASTSSDLRLAAVNVIHQAILESTTRGGEAAGGVVSLPSPAALLASLVNSPDVLTSAGAADALGLAVFTVSVLRRWWPAVFAAAGRIGDGRVAMSVPMIRVQSALLSLASRRVMMDPRCAAPQAVSMIGQLLDLNLRAASRVVVASEGTTLWLKLRSLLPPAEHASALRFCLLSQEALPPSVLRDLDAHWPDHVGACVGATFSVADCVKRLADREGGAFTRPDGVDEALMRSNCFVWRYLLAPTEAAVAAPSWFHPADGLLSASVLAASQRQLALSGLVGWPAASRDLSTPVLNLDEYSAIVFDATVWASPELERNRDAIAALLRRYNDSTSVKDGARVVKGGGVFTEALTFAGAAIVSGSPQTTSAATAAAAPPPLIEWISEYSPFRTDGTADDDGASWPWFFVLPPGDSRCCRDAATAEIGSRLAKGPVPVQATAGPMSETALRSVGLAILLKQRAGLKRVVFVTADPALLACLTDAVSPLAGLVRPALLFSDFLRRMVVAPPS